MASVFKDLLKIKKQKKRPVIARSKTAVVNSDGTCPTLPSSPSSSASSPTDSTTQIAFLQTILEEQKDTVDSLMDSAKKINPVAQKISTMENAYQAAFESDDQASLPTMSGSLQGYTIVFFFLSFFAISIVVSMIVNQATGSTMSAVKTFAGFMVLLIVSIALITRFG